MWLFTSLGFFSVVCARLDKGAGRPDVNRLMVRARRIAHLEALKDAFPDLLAGLEIHRSPSADYAARIFVPKAIWAAVMPRLVAMIDYDNFKSELSRTGQREYHDACSSVWGVMHRLQRPAPRKDVTDSFPWDREPTRFASSYKSGVTMSGASKRNRKRESSGNVLSPIVAVVSRWSDSGGPGVLEDEFVLTDIEHYKRSRVAIRDAAQRGWCQPIPRSRTSIRRMSAIEAQALYPNLKRISMKGVIPSVLPQVHLRDVAVVQRIDVPPPSGLVAGTVKSKENPMDEKQNPETKSKPVPTGRVIDCDIRLTAKNAQFSNVSPRPAPLVEDTSVVGGVDEVSGAPVIRPRTSEGVADESVRATDPRERHA